MKPIFHGKTLVYTSALLLLAACGGGGSGSSDGTNTDKEPTSDKTANLAVTVHQLPAGAKVELVQNRGEEKKEALVFQADGTKKLPTVAQNDTLQLLVTPPQPQTALLQCHFDDSDLGSVQSNGTFKLDQALAADNPLGISCVQSVLISDEYRVAGESSNQFAYLWLDLNRGRATWAQDKDGQPVINGNGLAAAAKTVNNYINGKSFFQATDATHGIELWSSDGTAAGTGLAVNITPDTERVSSTYFGRFLTTSKQTLLMWSRTVVLESDGTPENTRPLANEDGQNFYILPNQYTVIGNTLYFVQSGQAAIELSELWTRDLDTGRSRKISNAPNAFRDKTTTIGLGGSDQLFQAIGDKIIFTIRQSSSPQLANHSLGVTDGTEAGTKEIIPKEELVMLDEKQRDSKDLSKTFAVYDNALYFIRNTSDYGQELWKTDGETHTRLSDVGPGALDGNIQFPTATEQGVFFLADDGNGIAVWFTRGTPESTQQAAPASKVTPRIVPPASILAKIASPLHKAGKNVVFQGEDGHIWGSNGTEKGTQRLFPAAAAGTPAHAAGQCKADSCTLLRLDTVNDQALIAIRSTSGTVQTTQYWLTDGTPEGTRAVKDATGQKAFSYTIDPSA
ncbi:hypothetical protein [Kerstersia similis]|uniref:hypothetical protein n=1 Tax=Kerstersia similis TaxID=206505 RepID=UPI0039F054D8